MKRAVAWLRSRWRGCEKPVAGAYYTLFGPESAEGRQVIADLAAFCNVTETSFLLGAADATAFNEGKRAVFLHIAEMAGLTPVDFSFEAPREED